jgi:hypothetical protein
MAPGDWCQPQCERHILGKLRCIYPLIPKQIVPDTSLWKREVLGLQLR